MRRRWGIEATAMHDARATARRFRREAGLSDVAPAAPDRILPRLYPVATLLLPGLCVENLHSWLERHAAGAGCLAGCRNRELRGAVIAWRGQGLLCADAADDELEQRFTLAHEAGHFLNDHYYPRQDLLARFGEGLAPVLDGLRSATPAEQVQAVLGRTRFSLYTHLLPRDGRESGGWDALAEAEDGADAFACELLAPEAAVLPHCPSLGEDAESISHVLGVLSREFGIPPLPARRYAARLVARHGAPVAWAQRLRLV